MGIYLNIDAGAFLNQQGCSHNMLALTDFQFLSSQISSTVESGGQKKYFGLALLEPKGCI